MSTTNNNTNMNPGGNANVNPNAPVDSLITSTEVDWTSDHEDILVEWADKAMCFRWLHSRAHAL